MSLAQNGFRLCQFNVENLFLFLDFYKNQDLGKVTEVEWRRFSSSTTPNKSLRKCRLLAHTIQEIDAHIYALNEVGGLESLKNFNAHFLDGAYDCYLKEGNSPRGIDIGYLIKKDVPLKPLLISHRNRPINFLYPHEHEAPGGGRSHYFSRDVAELRLFKKGESSPHLVILLVHLKSKLDPDGIDPAGRRRREAEVKALVQIYNDLRTELSKNVPVIVCGDFNGQARKLNGEPEFSDLFSKTDLVDSFEELGLDEGSRFSQIQIQPGGKSIPLQIDYIFCSPDLKDRLIKEGSAHWLYNTELGHPAPLPKSLEERDLLPSDHYPMVLQTVLLKGVT
jgi:hypothetical protein